MTIREYLRKRHDQLRMGLVIGSMAFVGLLIALHVRHDIAVVIGVLVGSCFLTIYAVMKATKCPGCSKPLGSAGYFAVSRNETLRDRYPACPHCGLRLDEEIA